MAELWVSVDDVAAYLGIAKDSVYRRRDLTNMLADKIGKFGKFKLSEVNEWTRSGGANEQPTKRSPPVRRGKKTRNKR